MFERQGEALETQTAPVKKKSHKRQLRQKI